MPLNAVFGGKNGIKNPQTIQTNKKYAKTGGKACLKSLSAPVYAEIRLITLILKPAQLLFNNDNGIYTAVQLTFLLIPVLSEDDKIVKIYICVVIQITVPTRLNILHPVFG